MTKKLLFSLSLLSGTAFGQSFTATNEFQIGDKLPMFMVDSAAPSFASVKGTGVSWDYSMYMKMPNPNRLDSIYANTNTTDYPNSNKVNSIQNVLTTFLNTNASGRSVEGLLYSSGSPIVGNVKLIFNTDNLNYMTYPFALNNNITDVFSGSMTSNLGPSTASGTSTSVVDALGTLKLSKTITKSNVLRHNLIDSISTTVFGQNLQIIINEFDYYEFNTGNLPIFTYVNVRLIQNGTNLLSSLNFVLNSVDPVFFVGMEENTIEEFSVSPNPSSDEITISSSKFDGNETFKIFDLAGKEMKTSSSTKINISNLNAGVYLVEVEKNGMKSQQRFIKN